MASSLNLAGKWGCCVGSCLKRKRGAYPPTHKRASLAFLSVFQRTRREGDEETKTEIKRRAEAIAILTAPASQSVRSGCDGSTRWICEKQLGNFYFSPLSSPGYRQYTSGKFLWETRQRMQKKRGKLFPPPLRFIISSKCMCVSVGGGFAWVWDESWTPVSKLEQPLQVWLVHGACLLLLLQMFIFPLVVGILVRKDGLEREWLFENQLGECRQGSASWLCGLGWCAGRFLQVDYSALSHGKQSVEMTQSRVTAPHASLW